MDMSEKQMAEVIIAHAHELLGEQLSLISRNLWIGRYELDLLFEDRHGAKLIVELQIGSLDRYHLYKVLDYYDEYKTRHPQEFVEVMVVANLISPERKERLAKRGINYREIPEEIIRSYVAKESPLPHSPSETAITKLWATEVSTELMSNAPQWFRAHMSALHPSISQCCTERLPAIFQYFHDPDTWAITAAFGTYWQNRLNSFTEQDRHNLFDAVAFAVGHLYSSLLGKKGGLPYDRVRLAASACAPDLIPFLLIGYDDVPTPIFLRKREKLLSELTEQCRENPSFLLTLCSSHRAFWSHYPEGLTDMESQIFLEHLGVCLADIVREVAHSHFGNAVIPVGVDRNNQFITRPIGPNPASRGDVFKHLSVVLALPSTITTRLWNPDEALSPIHIEDAFPSLENSYTVGAEMLINAYGSRAYTIDQVSEVLIQSGETKSIAVFEAPDHSFGYKAVYRNGTISLGQVKLTIEEDGKLTCDHYSTNTIFGFITFSTREEPSERANLAGKSGNEFALIAAIIRDFLVCEEKESFYSGKGHAKKSGKKASLVVRYLPRFRIRYIGVRQPEYTSRRSEVIGHHVSGHLRQCRMPSPAQLVLARQFGIPVPDGFTFVRPHDRGGSSKVLYRSRSALQMLYG